MGDYESLNEQPAAIDSQVDFLCFTNNRDLKSETWKIIHTDGLIEGENASSQRYVKILHDQLGRGYKYSLYIDNSVILKDIPIGIISDFITSGSQIGLSYHSFRENVLDEFLAVSFHGYDYQSRILEQIEFYRENYLDCMFSRVFWGGFILRNHTFPSLRSFEEKWFAHVLRFSGRDQLSLAVLLHSNGIDPYIIPIDNNDSAFHTWPNAKNRKLFNKSVDANREITVQEKIRSSIKKIRDNKGGRTNEEQASSKNTIFKDIHSASGSNSSGSGGSISFGIAEFPYDFAIASIKGDLINKTANELQGDLSFSTRPLGSPGQHLTTRMRLKANGVLHLVPLAVPPVEKETGDIFLDRTDGELKICLDGATWRKISTQHDGE